jgi:hypothetical protein
MSDIIKKFDEFSIILEKKTTKEKSVKKDDSKSDEETYLSPKQRKLPDALKKGLIAKYKKSPKKSDDEKGDKEVKEPKKIDISKSDEENYLSAKQRKLPDGLKKGIIARNKKK